MIEDYYRIPDSISYWNSLRSEGYLGDAEMQSPNGETFRFEHLPPLVRTLLATDGTVTKVLEAYFWEPVNVQPVRLEVLQTTQPIPWLNLNVDGQDVLTREVHLIGAHHQHHYAQAFSIINLQSLEPHLRESLIHGNVGIGTLLRESGIETYREVLHIGLENANRFETGGVVGLHAYRIYRIIHQHTPVMIIRESFPLDFYQRYS